MSSFEIDEKNWKDLAKLADKYMINSLRKDLRVFFPENTAYLRIFHEF